MKIPTLTRYRVSLYIIFMIFGSCIVAIGFAAGFTYGTGQSPITIFIEAKSIAPPIETATIELNEVKATLDIQPKVDYQEGYNCMDYAWNAMRTLQWKGQPSAIVRLGFSGGLGHAVLLVPTADKGYQFIEPQSNVTIHPKVGGIYDGETITNMTVLTFVWQTFDIFLLAPYYGTQDYSNSLEDSK